MRKESVERPPRVGLISLGCAKNLVDAEIMLGSLLKEGVEITNNDADADVLIVNTCSFIDSAQEESVDTILEAAELRERRRPGQALVVAGCLPQRFRDDLPRLLPEVDAFMGIDQVTQIGRILAEALARRAEKAGACRPTGSVQKGKQRVMDKLGESGGRRGSDENGKQTEFKAGKAQKTKVVLSTPKAAPTPAFGSSILEVNLRPTFIPDYATPRFRLTPKHLAYLKIAEGCNHPCSFCIIPRIRGSHRSRPQPDIVAEARSLIAEGVKELNLISQDSTYYGLDLRPEHSRAIAGPDRFRAAVKSLPGNAANLCTLIRELNALEGDFWIRLLYTHPAHWTDELIATIAACPKVARYVDIPLQHIHDNMLERMRRETSSQYIVELLQRIRAAIPGIALRTTFIVGFPGETESCFQALLDFIRDTKFERLGVFTYSQEEGTRAGQMSGQVSPAVRQERRHRAMAVQHEVAAAVASSFVGRTLRVLVENPATQKELQAARISSWEHGLLREQSAAKVPLRGRFLSARGEADAPDIDGRVYIRGDLPLGQFATVRIIGHTDYDLIAEPV